MDTKRTNSFTNRNILILLSPSQITLLRIHINMKMKVLLILKMQYPPLIESTDQKEYLQEKIPQQYRRFLDTEVTLGEKYSYGQMDNKNVSGLSLQGDILPGSKPVTYKYDETLKSFLKSESVFKLKLEEKEPVKRESFVPSVEDLDKIKIKSLERINLGLPHDVLKRKKLRIYDGENLVLCRETQNGGTVEVLLDSFQSDGKDTTLIHVISKENTFIISKLSGGTFVELRRIRVPGKRFLDITSWQQFGGTFILAKTYLINPSSIPGMRFILYGYNVDSFEFIQEFDGSATRMPHHFQINFQDFLAVPNFLTGESCDPNTNSVVFKYTGKEFELNDYFPTNSAIISLTIEHKKMIWLIVLSSLKGISFYTIHDSRIEEISPEFSYELQSKGLADLVQFNIGFDSYIGVRSILGVDPSWKFFRINFDKENIKVKSDVVRNWCHNSLKLLNEKFQFVENKINQISFEKSNTGNTYENLIEKAIDEATFSKFHERARKVEADLSGLESRVTTTKNKVSDGINIRKTTEWPDGLNFSSIVINKARVDGFFVKNIHNKKVPSVQELIPLNSIHGINLHKKAFSDVNFKQKLGIENLNDLPLSSYVTLGGNHSIKSVVTFNQIDTPKLKVGGLIDGVKIDKNSILLNSGTYFNGSLTCSSISATNIETDFINGVNIRKLMSNTFVENSSITIKGNLEIRGDLTYPGNLTVGSILGKPTKYFTDNLLYLNSGDSQVITGYYHIKNANAKKLYIQNTLNSLSFPESVYINLPTRAYHIPKARFENLSARKVFVDKNLNGIKVLDGELDVITLRGDQIVTGRKSFEGMHLKNYIVIKNRSSEFEKPQEISVNANLNKELQFYETSIKLKNSLETENNLLNSLFTARNKLGILIDTMKLNVQEAISNENNYPFISKVLFNLDEDVLKLLSHLETKNFTGIENLLQFSHNEIIQLRSLSTFKALPQHLISTVKKFYNDLKKAYELIQILIAQKEKKILTFEESIKIFEKKIRKWVERYNGRIDFKGSFVRGLVNGYDLSEVSQRKRENSLITESEILDKLEKADLVVFKKLNTPSINKINIDKLLEEAVPLSSNNTNLNLVFEDAVDVRKNVETPFINGKVVSKLAKTNELNIFEKEVEFKDVRFFTDVEVKGNVNGFELQETAASTARTDRPQKFTVPISFNSVDANRINASNIYMNNLLLEEFAMDGENLIITVEKDLTVDQIRVNKLIVKGNIYIQRYIRDFNHGPLNISSLFEEAVLNDQAETINGSLILQGNVLVKKLNFKNSFDGISSETFDNFVLQMEDQHLNETNVFQSLKVKNLVIKDNMLQGLSLQKLFTDSVKIDEDQTFYRWMSFVITGKKTFAAPVTTNSEITVNGMVNDVKFGEVCKDIAGKIEINGPVNFENDLTIDSLQIGNHLIPNNYSFYWTKDDNVKIGNHIVFNEVKSKGIFVLEKLNDEPISNLLDGPIPSNCKETLKLSNLTVKTLATNYANVKDVQAQNLDDEDSKILKKIILDSLDQTFENLEVDDLSVTGEILVKNFVNEFRISDFCVHGPACEIKATKIFYNDVNVLKNWDIEDDSRINNIRIQDLKTSDLFSTETVVIKGSLKVPDLTVNGLVQGVKFDQDSIMTYSTPQSMNGSLRIYNKYNVAFKAIDATVLIKTFNGVDINVPELQFQKSEYMNEDIRLLKNMAQKYQDLKDHAIRVISVLKVYIKINCTEDVKGFYAENDLYICASVSCPNPNTNLSTTLKVSPGNVPVTEKLHSYLWRITPRSPVLYAGIATSKVDQILSFKISNRNCMLFLRRDKDEQNILCKDKWSIILQQTLMIKGVIKALHFTYTSSTQRQIPILIIGSEEASNELPLIRVLQLSHKSNHYETIQEIQADRLVWISTSDINDAHFLASVHKPFIGSVEGFELGGSLHIPGAKSISSWAWKNIDSYNLAVSVEETCSNGRLNDTKSLRI
ncbi:hypothetical protein Anas_06240 [Armadillidium nasatum]|uniref:Uncharacterized protein n=1 Tax=Armadillidium nasatum TaxID=96803 RepID=A0A5N5SUW6_9CRUS|nr:hypothetical protein Anas_06240 [Armadillidium nasatum]